jgi:hypothetical protein
LSFNGPNDANLPQDLIPIIKSDRAAMLKSDAFRSLFLVIIAFAILWFSLKNKLKPLVAILVIGILSIGDIWLVDTRIINPDKYITLSTADENLKTTDVDLEILKDKDLNYRVLDLSKGSPFTNAFTSGIHKSVGGYHAAKMMKYQELIEKYLQDPSKYMNVYSLLNTKYVIQQSQEGKMSFFRNEGNLGNAWFVKNIKVTKNADEELDALGTLDGKNTVVMQQNQASDLNGFNIQYDSTNTIKLVKYIPDNLEYVYTAKTDQFAVFSEVYYPSEKGWNMYLDGKLINPIKKVNYTLRGAKLPAGNNRKLEMKFEPKAYYSGIMYEKFSSLILLFLLLAGIVLFLRKYGLPNFDLLPTQLITEIRPKIENKISNIQKKK